jgi:putative transposase
MSGQDRELPRKLIKQYNLKDTKDIKNMLKGLFGNTIQEMLEAVLEEDLGYSKYDYKNKETLNSRNGHSGKTLKSDHGKIDIKVPRDREGQFEPKIVKKNQTDISSIEDQVLSMYGKGMTVRDIENYLSDCFFNRKVPRISIEKYSTL